MAHDVFISYPGKDKTVADAVCAKLEDQKIRCWIAPRDIPAGKNFAESIIDAIDNSKVFVLIWSMNTNSSEHILNEINQAFNQGIPIIPFRIQEVEPTSAMRYYFGRTHWLDAVTPPLERHIDLLAGSILAILERTPEVIPEPVVVQAEPVAGKPPAREPELNPHIDKNSWQGQEAEGTSRSPIKPLINPPFSSSPKRRILIPIAVGVLAVAVIVAMILSGVFKAAPTVEETAILPQTTLVVDATASQAPVSVISDPTKMIVTPISTSTPIPAWMEEVSVWANPILVAIKTQPPDFEDVFSERDSAWDVGSEERFCPGFDPAGKFIVRNGELLLVLKPSCRFMNFTHPDIEKQLGDYVLQADINLAQTASGFTFSAWAEQKILLGFILKDGNWSLIIPVPNSEEGMQTIQEGAFSFESSNPVTFTVVKNQATFLFYLEDKLLLSYGIPNDRQGPQRLVFAVETWRDQDFDSESITVDNLRLWELDKLDITGSTQVQIESLPSGSIEISSVDGMKMVYIPAGEFAMGSLDNEGVSPEHPQHTVYLDAYWIDQTEVTNEMYQTCVKRQRCTPPQEEVSSTREEYFSDPTFGSYPVIYVTWEQAQAYCEWTGRKLPTEAQWEKAAKGAEDFKYPWGQTLGTVGIANFAGIRGDTLNTGAFPRGASPYNVLDMAGNVQEWTADWNDNYYYQNSPSNNPTGPESGIFKVVRGGSWASSVEYEGSEFNSIRVTERGSLNPDQGDHYTGFRCVKPQT